MEREYKISISISFHSEFIRRRIPEENGRIFTVNIGLGLSRDLLELGLEFVQRPDVLDHVVHWPK